MTRNVIDIIEDFEKIIDQFKDEIKKLEEPEGESPEFWDIYNHNQRKILGASDFMARLDDRFRPLFGAASLLGGEIFSYYGNLERFMENIEVVKKEFNKIKEIIEDFVSLFDHEERRRIEEAYHTLIEDCFWSSIINSAVALEKRLFSILKSRNTKFMKERNPNLRYTLGALIRLYLDNEGKFQSCIPNRHHNLLSLTNDYRILSAHSKQSDFDRPIADAILNLTIKFLIDNDCRPVRRKKRSK